MITAHSRRVRGVSIIAGALLIGTLFVGNVSVAACDAGTGTQACISTTAVVTSDASLPTPRIVTPLLDVPATDTDTSSDPDPNAGT